MPKQNARQVNKIKYIIETLRLFENDYDVSIEDIHWFKVVTVVNTNITPTSIFLTVSIDNDGNILNSGFCSYNFDKLKIYDDETLSKALMWFDSIGR